MVDVTRRPDDHAASQGRVSQNSRAGSSRPFGEVVADVAGEQPPVGGDVTPVEHGQRRIRIEQRREIGAGLRREAGGHLLRRRRRDRALRLPGC